MCGVPQNAEQPRDLAALVKQARKDRDMSVRDVAAASGGVISSTTVHDIETGRRGSVGPQVLGGLSKALGLPLSQLRAAQGHTGKVPSQPFVLPARANELTARQRRVVTEMVDLLLEANRR